MENNKPELKDFIYLDTSHITSMLAQINRGNILNITDVKEKNKSNTDETIESGGGGSVGIKTGIKVVSLEIQRNIEKDKTITTNYVGKTEQQLINKAMDDYSYDLFSKYLKEENLIISTNAKDGDYINIKGNFNIFDFNYLIKVIDSIKDITENPYISNRDVNNVDLQNTKEILQAAKDVLSTENFIFIDNFVVIPNNDYFRYKGIQFTLKYNTKVNVLAKVIKKVNAKEDNGDGIKALMNFADIFVPIINENILKLPKRNVFYYVMPIAIY